MFNVVIDNYEGQFRLRYFNTMVFDHEPPYNKGGTKVWVQTPFNDDDGTPLMARPMPTQEEIEQRKALSQQASLSRTKNMIHRIARSTRDWKWFCTFTFDPNAFDTYDYSTVVEFMSKFLKKLMRLHPTLKYIVVPEQHKSGRWHFHGLFSDEVVTKYSGCYKNVHTWHLTEYDYGFCSATKVRSADAVAVYITKYMTKDLVSVTKYKRRYWWSVSTIQLAEKFNFLMTPEQFRDFLSATAELIRFGGVRCAHGTEYEYTDFYFDTEAFDYIFEYATGYDDGIYYCLSDTC